MERLEWWNELNALMIGEYKDVVCGLRFAVCSSRFAVCGLHMMDYLMMFAIAGGRGGDSP